MSVTISNSYNIGVTKRSTSATLTNVVVATGEVIYLVLSASQKSGGASKFATGATFNGSENFVKVGTGQTQNDKAIVEIWKLTSPSATTANVVVSWPDNNATWNGAIIGCYVLAGVDNTTPDDGYQSNTGTGYTTTLAITTSSGDMTFSVSTHLDGRDATYDVGGGGEQAKVWGTGQDNMAGASGNFEADDSSATHAWQLFYSTPWSIAGVSINPAAGGTPAEDVKSASTRIKRLTEDVKSASTRIKRLTEDIKSASTRIAYSGEDVKSASTRIKRLTEDVKNASTNIKRLTEDVKSASTRIAYSSQVTKAASTRIAYSSQDVKSASTRISIPMDGEDVKLASTLIKRLTQDIKSASTNIKLLSEDVKSASTRIAYSGEDVKSASTRIKRPSEDIKSASTRIIVQVNSEDVKNASTNIKRGSESVKNASTRIYYAGYDTKLASTRIKRLSADIKTASTNIKRLTEDIKNASTRIKLLSEDVKSASTRIKRLSEDIKTASTRIKRVAESIKSASTRVGLLTTPSEDVKNASTRIAFTSQDIKTASTRISRWGQDIKSASTQIRLRLIYTRKPKTYVQGARHAIELNDTTQYLNINDSPSLRLAGLDKMSLEFWFKQLSYPSWSIATRPFYRNSVDNGIQVHKPSSRDDLWCYAKTETGVRNMGMAIVATTGVWYHLVVVYDGAYLRPYVNGSPSTPFSLTGVFADTAANLVFNTSKNHHFLVDNVRFYNEALTAGEVLSNMQNYHSPVTSGLVMWLKMNEGAGLVAYDLSVNDNHGYLSRDGQGDYPNWVAQLKYTKKGKMFTTM